MMLKKTIKNKIIVITFLIGCMLWLTSCSNASGDSGASQVKAGEPISASEFLLDTICTITVYSKNDEKYIDESFQLIAEYEMLLSRTIEDSEIAKINNANGAEVTVSDYTIDVIERAKYYSEKADGIFDISIGAITSKWDFSEESEGKLPDENEIADLLPAVDYRAIQIDGNNVSMLNEDAKLDLGAIAKGYIADRVADYLTDNGVEVALIDLGGNVVTVGEKEEGKPWNIGIRNPFPQEGDDAISIIGSVEIEGRKSIGTSGTYERFFMKDDIRYHHILDVNTGFPSQSDLAGVTVITDESVDGEGYTTICILLGSEAAVEFLEENDIQAILVKEDGAILQTSNVKFTPLS